MFVQGPQMVPQGSEISEESSEEDATGDDILQVVFTIKNDKNYLKFKLNLIKKIYIKI